VLGVFTRPWPLIFLSGFCAQLSRWALLLAPFFTELGPHDRLRNRGLVSPYRDSDVAISYCMNPASTEFPISRCAYSLRVSPFGYVEVYVTYTYVTVAIWFPIGIRGFGVCDVNERTPLGFPIPDLRCHLSLTPGKVGPSNTCPHLITMVVGPVAFREFATSPVVISLYTGNPKCRTPSSFRSSDTRPSDQRLLWCREIANRDFVARVFYYPRTLDIPNSELSGISRHASSLMDGPDRPSLFRGFGLRGFVMQRFRVHEIPDTPIPGFPMGS
jgi:hypothetical protein